jgi:hypothetical protein
MREGKQNFTPMIIEVVLAARPASPGALAGFEGPLPFRRRDYTRETALKPNKHYCRIRCDRPPNRHKPASADVVDFTPALNLRFGLRQRAYAAVISIVRPVVGA